jgi:hypothetical protein
MATTSPLVYIIPGFRLSARLRFADRFAGDAARARRLKCSSDSDPLVSLAEHGYGLGLPRNLARSVKLLFSGDYFTGRAAAASRIGESRPM